MENIKENKLSGILSGIGLLAMSIFGGFAAGLAFGVIGSFIYLVLVFPVLMGFAGGYVIKESVKYAKTRDAYFVIVSSVLTAVILYGTFHYMRYVGLQAAAALQAFGDLSDKSLEAAKVVVEYGLKKETGHAGFVGYMLYKASQGVSIGRIFSSSRLNLGPIFTWVYWLIEIGIITYITYNIGKQVTKKKFCEFCHSWYPEQRHVGGITGNKEAEILNWIKHKDFSAVGANLEEDPDLPSVELYLQSCQSCDKSDSFLSVSKVRSVNGRLVFSELLKTTLNPRETKLLMENIR